MKSEDEVQQLGIIEAAKRACYLLRNNAGAMQTKERQVRFGLGNTSKKLWDQWKTGDYIGIKYTKITPEMVGQTVGIFTMIEFKEEGWIYDPTDEHQFAQKSAIDWVNARGGIAGFAASVDDVIRLLTK